MKGRSLMLGFFGGEHGESHFKWSLPSEQRAAELHRAGGSPLTLGRTSQAQDGGYQTLCRGQHGPSLGEEWGEERTGGVCRSGNAPCGSEGARTHRHRTADFVTLLPRRAPVCPGSCARAMPARAGWRDSAPKPQLCAALHTHSKKSSRSGGYLPKSAVRFLAASSLARQESWAERGCS